MDFPNLKAAKAIAVDIESKDPLLLEHGPQFHSDKAHMVGCAIGTEDKQWYFPIRHESETEDNLPKEKVILFLKDILSTNIPKIGTNIIYDLQGLRKDGIEVNGKLFDVQIIEPLLDENKIGKYNLNALAWNHLKEKKNEEKLYQWLADHFGGKPTRKQQAGRIHLAPPRIVAPYAKSDVDLPFRILQKQWAIVIKEELERVVDIEHRLIPLLLEMRWQGVRVDLEKAIYLKKYYTSKIRKLKREIEKAAGVKIDSIWKADTIRIIFNKLKLRYPLTPKTKKPSFTSEFISNHKNPIVNMINSLRQLTKFRDTFIINYILEGHCNGRIHCQFNQLVGENGLGPKSGRFSSSNPNLQNIPIRTKEGKLIRSCFIPEHGYDWWKHDYSQIEYRMLVHYATGKAAAEVKEKYRIDPKIDYHNAVKEKLMQHGLKFKGDPRRVAKDCNFGIVYGLGEEAMAKRLGLSLKEAKKLRDQIHAISPYAKNLFNKAMAIALTRGYIKHILGGRARFPFFEPRDFTLSKHPEFTPSRSKQHVEMFIEEKAKYNEVHYGIKRAFAYTALNRLLQGSAAYVLKVAMVELFECGIYEEIPYPHLTVHDELDHSLPKKNLGNEYAELIEEVMGEAVKLSIPIVVDKEKGGNWGELKEVK